MTTITETAFASLDAEGRLLSPVLKGPITPRVFGFRGEIALKFAEKLTREPRNISDADIAALKQHFSEAEIVDLDLLIGLVNLTNRLTDPLGAEVEFPEEKI